MKILLIAGHGYGDPGATAKIGGTTYREADETRKMVSMLAPRLQAIGAEVTIYNMDYNAYNDWRSGSLLSRAKFKDFDYVFEVHLNAFALATKDGKTKGTEIFVTTKETSTGVEEAIVRNIAALGFTNRGVKKKNFAVINAAKGQGTSSALIELCFIDDYDDMTLYVKSREKVADAITAGIAEGFGLSQPAKQKESDTVPVYKTLDDIPDWAKETVKKLIDHGSLQGEAEGNLNLDRNMLRLLVINDREGCYGK